MDSDAVLTDLLAILEQNSVQVRSEPMGGGGGGLCKIKGKLVFFADTDAQIGDVIRICADVIRQNFDTTGIYLKPAVRQLLGGDGDEID